ncbi:uncharacterized protein LOC135374513 [Ornithodoros turicata]|uniref:uncharacterized protein LOC135374513 n=1 Tax=Ornithodoros turicata TaxID=34597 RepID=UPI00313A03F4
MHAYVSYVQDTVTAIVPVPLIRNFRPKSETDFDRNRRMVYWCSKKGGGSDEEFYEAEILDLAESKEALILKLKHKKLPIPTIFECDKEYHPPSSLKKSVSDTKKAKENAKKERLKKIASHQGKVSQAPKKGQQKLNRCDPPEEECSSSDESVVPSSLLVQKDKIIARLKKKLCEEQDKNNRLTLALLDKIEIARETSAQRAPMAVTATALYFVANQPQHIACLRCRRDFTRSLILVLRGSFVDVHVTDDDVHNFGIRHRTDDRNVRIHSRKGAEIIIHFLPHKIMHSSVEALRFLPVIQFDWLSRGTYAAKTLMREAIRNLCSFQVPPRTANQMNCTKEINAVALATVVRKQHTLKKAFLVQPPRHFNDALVHRLQNGRGVGWQELHSVPQGPVEVGVPTPDKVYCKSGGSSEMSSMLTVKVGTSSVPEHPGPHSAFCGSDVNATSGSTGSSSVTVPDPQLELYAVVDDKVHLGNSFFIPRNKLDFLQRGTTDSKLVKDVARHLWTIEEMTSRSITGQPCRRPGVPGSIKQQATPAKVEAITNVLSKFVEGHPNQTPAEQRMKTVRKTLSDFFADMARQGKRRKIVS